ncbi:ABC transporter permease [Bacillus horti]|uniref:ABC-2 type transport system permease protein n=1 Tax=Caldalkalibacillus horti TaxID=77523 RepID=A0ABT9VW65_9BACI|nr:ABC transporter permease [Bacillus horti]MDQ0165235.1 ABC-2 type transport system permease protein [Bacillus horti]
MKLDVKELYQKRFKEFTVEILKYRSAFANNGLLVTIIFLTILAGVYYRQMIDLIPEQFPVDLALTVLLAIVLTVGRHRTFLKEADMLFLPTLEREMEHYFSKTLRYNLLLQCGLVFVLLLMLKPLYDAKIPLEQQNLLLFYLIPVLAKGWNVYSSWNVLRVPYPDKRFLHGVARLLFNGALLYWFFSGGTFLIFESFIIGGAVLGLAVIAFFMYERNMIKRYLYRWMNLLEMEQKLQAKFYGFINLFVDVPHIGKKVKERKWLSWLGNILPFNRKQAYLYLLLKTFMRTEEYSSRFFRLSIVAMLLIWWLPNIYVKAAIGLGFIFITFTQMKGMKNYHQRQFWQGVFPWPHHLQQSSYRKLTISLMMVQAVLFSLVLFVTQ